MDECKPLVNGMGISAGKSMVYAACGVKPEWLLPIQVRRCRLTLWNAC